MTEHAIQQKLQAAFSPAVLQVENESHNHSSRPGNNTHFKVTLVSEAFSGLNPVARHRAVYAVLKEELANGVHALALHTFAPGEWQGESPASPRCMAGEKN